MHEIKIIDPMYWEGPDGQNRLLAQGIGSVYGSPNYLLRKESYLLAIIHPFLINGEEVRQLVVSERLSGTSLEEVMTGECPININRVRPEIKLKQGDEYSGLDIESWAIGYIKLL
jgi:hypothetical protein